MAAAKVFLSGDRRDLTLSEKTALSADVFRLRFSLDSKDQALGLPVGQCVLTFAPNKKGKVSGEWNGKADSSAETGEVCRCYTPISGDELKGFVDFVVKSYRPNATFADGGKCSQHFESLAIGSKLAVKGPIGKIHYAGNGEWMYNKEKLAGNLKTKVSMIAGGTGITPMLRILKAVFEDKAEDKTEVSLIYGNQTEGDILCRDLLEDFAKGFPSRFKLWYTVDKAPTGCDWKYSVGYVTGEMMKEHLFAGGDDTVCLLCGPPGMTAAAKNALTALGNAEATVLTF